MKERRPQAVHLFTTPSDEQLKAKHETMLFMRRWPKLWPTLDRMTLHRPIDWVAVLIALQHERSMQIIRAVTLDPSGD